MILCHCAGVSDAAIRRLIEQGAATLKEIVQHCGAGTCCAPCRTEIVAMLRAARGTRPAALPVQAGR